MTMETLLLSVSYEEEPYDFAAALSAVPAAVVKRAGAQRRTQVCLPADLVPMLRDALPPAVRIEPVMGYSGGPAGPRF